MNDTGNYTARKNAKRAAEKMIANGKRAVRGIGRSSCTVGSMKRSALEDQPTITPMMIARAEPITKPTIARNEEPIASVSHVPV